MKKAKLLIIPFLMGGLVTGLASCENTPTVTPEATLDSINVTAPSKVTYTVGENLDLTGMVVIARYSDNSTKTIPNADVTVSGYNANQEGEQTVTVTYEGKTATFKVTVQAAQKTLLGITVTGPTKQAYEIGDELDLTGLIVTAHYDDDTDEVLEGGLYQLSAFDSSTAGDKIITVTYEGKTASFTVTVAEAGQIILSSLDITPPTKTEYEIGDIFDSTGLVVNAVYSDGSTRALGPTDYQLLPPNMSTAGTKQVMIIYEGVTATFNIVVKEAGGGDDPAKDKVTIEVISQFGKAFQTTLERFGQEFSELNPHIEVKVTQESGTYDNVHDKTKTAMSANHDDWGDLVICYPDHVVDYIEYGKAVDLDQFIYNEDEDIALSQDDLDDFTDSARSYLDVKYPAKGTYAMPFAISTECMFYNPVLTTLTVPGINGGERIDEDYLNNLTWEELFDNFCPKILDYNDKLPDNEKFLVTKDGDKDVDYTVLGYDEDGNAFITLCEQYEYGYTSVNETTRKGSIDFNTKEVRDMMKKFNHARNEHWILSMGSNNDTRTSELFGKRQALLCIGSTGGISYQQQAVTSGGGNFEIGCARIPQAEGHDEKLVLQGGSFCILAHNTADNEARQLAAWEFYKYMTNSENSAVWAAQTGYAPMRNSVYDTDDWADAIDEEGKEGIELLLARTENYVSSITDYLFNTPVFKGSSAARTAVSTTYVRKREQSGVISHNILSQKELQVHVSSFPWPGSSMKWTWFSPSASSRPTR